jgi:crotonobetainyl-CoA:carnitine CoA-transferase CaiB-like acyl-CoA transferase
MKPLSGLIVLDLTRFLAGPYCTLLLGGLGAEVLKIEPPKGEDQRFRPPFAGPKGASIKKQTEEDVGLSFLHRARNKKGLTLNLRHPQGKEMFLRLCEKADVVVENFAAGTMDRMELGFPVLHARNPRLILCSISGFGQRGPHSEWRAYDPIIQAASGITSVTGYADRDPVRCGAAISDTTTPLYGVIGILAALQMREKTGQGDWVDMSMQDGSFFLLPEVMEFLAAGDEPKRLANAHVSGAPFNVYRAQDGFVSLCAVTQNDWRKLLAAIGRTELEGDPRFANLISRRDHREVVDGIVQDWIGKHTVTEAVDHLQKNQVPAGPVLSPTELLHDEHIKSRGMIVDMQLPRGGNIPGVKGIGMPIKFMRNPVTFDQPAPAVGEHNEELYERLLGMDRSQVQALKEQGII